MFDICTGCSWELFSSAEAYCQILPSHRYESSLQTAPTAPWQPWRKRLVTCSFKKSPQRYFRSIFLLYAAYAFSRPSYCDFKFLISWACMLSCASLLGTFVYLKSSQSISFSWTFLFPHMFVVVGGRVRIRETHHLRISFFFQFFVLESSSHDAIQLQV